MWWANLKLAKMVVLAIILSILVYYVPSLFIGFRTGIAGIDYTSLTTTEVVPQVAKETLRVFTDNSTQNTTTEPSLEKNIVQADELREYPQSFIYNIILSIAIATFVFTIFRRLHK